MKKNDGTEKMSTFLVKRKTDNWFGECFLTRRISTIRHLLESSVNPLQFSPYTRRSYLPKQSKPYVLHYAIRNVENYSEHCFGTYYLSPQGYNKFRLKRNFFSKPYTYVMG